MSCNKTREIDTQFYWKSPLNPRKLQLITHRARDKRRGVFSVLADRSGQPFSTEQAKILGNIDSRRFVLTPASSVSDYPVLWRMSSSASLRPSASVTLRWPFSTELANRSQNWPPFGQNAENPIFSGRLKKRLNVPNS